MSTAPFNKEFNRLLKEVSRSFYLSMVFLPNKMRGPISLAYLLARATDSVADSTQLSQDKKLTVLKQMGLAIQARLCEEETNTLLQQLANEFALAQEKAAEGRLLQEFGTCLQQLQQSDTGEQAYIREVLHTIVEGQTWDLAYFEQHAQVTSDEQTARYTYMVAGCVGEFWTKLGIYCMGHDGFCNSGDEERLLQQGINFGCGLQLVNILRDQQEDADHGRSYLTSDPAIWMQQAKAYLQDGVTYSLKLSQQRLRFTALLPALLGLKTLKAVELAEPNTKAKIKISRHQVYTCMLQALMMCQWRRC